MPSKAIARPLKCVGNHINMVFGLSTAIYHAQGSYPFGACASRISESTLPTFAGTRPKMLERVKLAVSLTDPHYEIRHSFPPRRSS